MYDWTRYGFEISFLLRMVWRTIKSGMIMISLEGIACCLAAKQCVQCIILHIMLALQNDSFLLEFPLVKVSQHGEIPILFRTVGKFGGIREDNYKAEPVIGKYIWGALGAQFLPD